jgi:hypothetical protein
VVHFEKNPKTRVGQVSVKPVDFGEIPAKFAVVCRGHVPGCFLLGQHRRSVIIKFERQILWLL